MNEIKTTLKRVAFYYLLLAVNIIPCASIIPDSFPARNVSAIYLLTLSVCLILYYSHRVTPMGGLSVMMKAISWMSMIMILLRGIKYSVFAQIDILARHTWYLYYVPMLLLPLFLFYVSLLVAPKKELKIPRGLYWTSAVTVVLIILVLTNDFHQLVFSFKPNFADWDNEYSHGFLFYVITFWQYALYFVSIIILLFKCRISSSKKNAWIILIPFLTGIFLNALIVTEKTPRINGSPIIEFPEALIFTVATVLECCMQLGLIPTNTDYGKLFQRFSISSQITDKNGTPIYSSHSAAPLTAEQFNLQSGERINEHTLLNKMEIPGGYGFWQDDMTELDRLNGELAEAKDELAQESELIRLRNELKENQTKIEQRTLVYDTIAKRTQKQSQSISRLAETARLSESPDLKEKYRAIITLLGAYIKRYANLMLLSQENNNIEAGELGLSVSEVLRYLNCCNIPSELFISAECTVRADSALAVFEAFETLLEANLQSLRGAFVNISDNENVLFKLNLENMAEALSDEMTEALENVGVSVDMSIEDDVAYICFTLPKGGEAV